MLIIAPDAFTGVGGGETAIGNIARSLPDWTFVNLTRTAAHAVPGRPNVELVRYRTLIQSDAARACAQTGSPWHRYDLEDTIAALNTAFSVRGQSFDYVDVPDYCSWGRFLPAAFAAFEVCAGKVVQSLHGRISNTYRHEWFKVGQPLNEYDRAKQRAEDLSLNAADGRYALSDFYRRHLRDRTSLPIELVDPLLCLELPDLDALPSFEEAVPQLVFVSRFERQKAGDRFIELLWHLGSETARQRLVIGNDPQLGGISGHARIEAHRRHRHVDNVEYLPQLSPLELRHRVFLQPSIVVLPTRFDTFNLTAIEAVLHGCPIVLGTNCGAYEYLRDRIPNLPLVVFDEGDVPGTANALKELIEHFGQARTQIIEAVRRANLSPCRESIVKAYAAPADHDPAARAEATRDFADMWRELSDRVLGVGVTAVAREFTEATAVSVTSPWTGRRREAALLDRLANAHERFQVFSAQRSVADGPVRLFEWLADIGTVTELVRRAGGSGGQPGIKWLLEVARATAPFSGEPSAGQLDDEVQLLRRLMGESPALFRTRLTMQLAAVERMRGHALLAAGYDFRVIRWLGDDRFALAPGILATLESHGMADVAAAVRLHVASLDPADEGRGIVEYLCGRLRAMKQLVVPDDYERVIDERRRARYRATVIVSLYDVTTPILARFLRMLGACRMIRRREAEVVFIDSGSPTPLWRDDDALFQQFSADFLFVRTACRETIQSAWNRGVRLARGEYLTCLGIDEALHPEALDVLADVLDRDPGVDWVMGDSVVTAVDAAGSHLDDKMAYLRSGNWTEAARLFDCTYLSYVGGMYRRSLHDRAGMYDPTFRGAGDTEFKCRAHPFMTTRHIPRTLGVFLDYSAARKTASYSVELEDVRAWYIFRTLGGAQYLLQGAGPERIEEIFWRMLTNRRAFTAGPESDLSFAGQILRLLKQRHPESAVLRHEDLVFHLLRTIRRIGMFEDWSLKGQRNLLDDVLRARGAADLCAAIRPDLEFPANLVRDAQFFSHAWTWDS